MLHRSRGGDAILIAPHVVIVRLIVDGRIIIGGRELSASDIPFR
jgi:hypothetical protein